MESNISIIDHVKSNSYHHLLHHLRNADYSQVELDEALWYTTRHGDLQTTRLLLSYGANFHSLNTRGMPILHGVVIGGHADILQCLLDAGYDVNYRTGDSEETGIGIPLHISVWKNDIEVVKILVNHGADMSLRDNEGNTAIQIASITGGCEVVNILLSAKCDVNCQNYKGESCLHLVVKNNHPQVIDMLLNSGIDVNMENENGDTALLMAARLQYVDILDKLLNNCAVQTDHKNKDGSNVLHLISPYADSLFATKVLKISRIELNMKDIYGNTALNVAACYQNEELLLFLLSRVSEADICNKGFLGRTVVHWVVLNRMKSALKVILEKGAHLDDTDEDNCTVFMLACKNNFIYEMNMLRHNGANINIPDIQGWSPLHWACYKGYREIVAYLMECTPNNTTLTNNSETPLILAIKGNNIDILKILLECKCHAENIALKDNTGKHVLHHAVETGDVKVLEFLLSNGCANIINEASDDTEHVISIAASKGLDSMLKMLLEFGANPNVLDKDGKSPLFDVIKHNCDIALIKDLLDKGANPNMDKNNNCALIEATKIGCYKTVELLLSSGATVDSLDKYNRTAFIWAAQKGCLIILNILHLIGANPKTVDISGDTALTVAAFEGHYDIVKFLIPHSDIDHIENEEGMTSLLLALSNGHTQCAQLLLVAGADVNIVAQNGNNALLTATAMKLGKSIIEQILLKGNSDDIHKTGDQGRTVLHWSVSDLETLEFFLEPEKQIDIDKLDGNGATALLLAIAHSQPESAMILIQSGCNTSILHEDGRQPIHHAAIYGEPEVLSLLLKTGMDCNTPALDGRIPVLLASIEGNSTCTQILLEAGADANDIYLDAITPLFAATNGGHNETMEVLLEYGANPDLIGSKKVRPIIASILRDDTNAVKLLLQWGSNLENYSDINNHPVTVALLKQRWGILFVLLEVLTDTNLVRNILKEGAIYYFVLDENVKDYLVSFIQSPVALQKLCRQSITSQLHFPLKPNIKKLHTSQVIEEYLLLEKL